jgi:hypothetical protein
MSSTSTLTADYVVHQQLRVRVEALRQRDLDTVSDQLGLQPTKPRDWAALMVRFRDQLQPGDNLVWAGTRRVGVEHNRIWIASDDADQWNGCLEIDDQGQAADVLVRSGVTMVPVLRDLVNLLALQQEILPVHAAGFGINGHGFVVTGLADAAQTTLLLAAMSREGVFVADDWVYLDPNSDSMWGNSMPLEIQAEFWPMLRQLPAVAPITIPWRSDLAQRALWATGVLPPGKLSESAQRIRSRLVRSLSNEASVQVRPEALFQTPRVRRVLPWGTLLLSVHASGGGVSTQQLSESSAAERLTAGLLSELEEIRHLALSANYVGYSWRLDPGDLGERVLALACRTLANRRTLVLQLGQPAEILPLQDVLLGLAQETGSADASLEPQTGAPRGT